MKKTVLIIDDEKHTRDGLRTALEEDYEVYVAGDAAGAMAGRASQAQTNTLRGTQRSVESSWPVAGGARA